MDSAANRRGWAERTGEFSPVYYAHLGPNKVSKSLVTALDHYVGTDAEILELGCSSGRHLAHLRENGYENLAGIDINDEAFEVMADHYPALAETGTFHAGPIERLLPEFETDRFDVVYSVETLQHVHPDDEQVFAEVARVASDLLVTTENEGEDTRGADDDSQENDGPQSDGPEKDAPQGDGAEGDGPAGERNNDGVNYVNDEFPLYYRDWERVFTDLGLVQLHAQPGERDTIRVFGVP